jgi:hypothetical protein
MKSILYIILLFVALLSQSACKKKALSEEQIETQKAEESILGFWQLESLRFEAPWLATFAERENLLCVNAYYLGVFDLLIYENGTMSTLFFEPQKGNIAFREFQDLNAKFTWTYNAMTKKYMLDYAKFVGEDKKFFVQYDVSGRIVLLQNTQKMPQCTYQAGKPVFTLQNDKPIYIPVQQNLYRIFKKVRPYAS